VRKLNLPFILGVLAVAAAVAGVIYFGRPYQVKRHASDLKRRAMRAVADQDLAKAAELLRMYLGIEREDGPAWSTYARVVEERARAHEMQVRELEQVYLLHEEALRHNHEDRALERKCADLALELARFSDARQHLEVLYQKAPKNARGEANDPVIEDLFGQCDQGESKFGEAEKWFRKAIDHDRGQAASYDRLARMLRGDVRPPQPDAADKLIAEMVRNGLNSPRAYLSRWRYDRDFRQAANPLDIKKALALKHGQDDPEVLLVAAGLSQRERDLDAARAQLRKGQTLDPRNLAFPTNLAQLELEDGHPERAEQVLREAAAANPRRELWSALAETLISQGKIEGQDQGQDYVNRARNSGLREGYVAYLESLIELNKKNPDWVESIKKINGARALLASDTATIAKLNLMLAKCYDRLGSDEQRLAALQQAAAGVRADPTACAALAAELARSGKLDEALAIHTELIDRRPESRLDVVRLLIRKALRQPVGRRNWQEVEERFKQAEKALPTKTEQLTLQRAEMLRDQSRFEEARKVVEQARGKDSKNVAYRVELATIARNQGNLKLADQILDQTQKDLGPSLEVRLARLDSWVSRGGSEAKSAVGELAKGRTQLPDAAQPAFLGALGQGAYRLGDLNLARQSYRALLALEPRNLVVMMGLFDLAIEADDPKEAASMVGQIRGVEGEDGALWRYGQAVRLIHDARRPDTAMTSHPGSGTTPTRPRTTNTQALATAETLVPEIIARRGNWWGGPFLRGEIAEFKGDLNAAIAHYVCALELGDTRPGMVRRLVAMLEQRQDFNQIDRVVQILQDRGVALDNLTSLVALTAIRKKDFARGVALARQAFPESSTRATDHLSLGRILFDAGRSEDASKEFRRAIELGPALPEAWLAHVECLAGAKRLDEAKAAIEVARKALPADQSAATLAQCLAMVGETKEADALFRSVLAARPNDPATLRAAARFYMAQRSDDQALALLTRLADPKTAAPGSYAAWGRAILLALRMRTSQRGEAIRQLEALEPSNQFGPFERFLLANLYYAEGREDRYRSEMLDLLFGKAKNPRHLAHFAAFLINRNEIEPAKRWVAELKRVDPSSPDALMLEALVLKAEKRDGDLLALLEARSRQNPEQTGAVASVMDTFGFAKQAEEAYNAEIARAPSQPEPPLALANFLARQARIDDSLEVLSKVWATGPLERVAFLAMGIYDTPSASERHKGQIEAWLVEAIQKHPEAAGLLPKLAHIRLRQGRFSEVETLLRQALASNTDDPEALNELAWVLSHGDQRSDKLPEALAKINQAIDVSDQNASFLDTRAMIFLQLGQNDQALRDLKRAVALRSASRNIHFHLASAYLKSGNKAEARKVFQRAQELGLKAETADPFERDDYRKLANELR
jgi:tetratricopeptide (TPR) repeat protein